MKLYDCPDTTTYTRWQLWGEPKTNFRWTKRGKGNTQYTKVTAHYVAKKIMKPKDKNYIKEIIDEVKSSEYSEVQATSKVTIAPIPNPGRESIKKSQITMFAKN